MKSRYFFAYIILSFAVLLAEVLPATAQDLTTLNWEFSSQGLPVTLSPPRSINITALVSQPNRFAPTTSLFAGTGGAGVYRSIDSGRTWAAVNSGLTA